MSWINYISMQVRIRVDQTMYFRLCLCLSRKEKEFTYSAYRYECTSIPICGQLKPVERASVEEQLYDQPGESYGRWEFLPRQIG